MRTRRHRARPARRLARAAVGGVVIAAVVTALAACTSQAGPDGPSSAAPSSTRTTIVGTSTITSTNYVTDTTYTAPPSTVDGSASTVTGGGVAGSTSPRTAGASTALPAAETGECPYISAEDVKDINGQHHGPTSIIPVKPYPICIFTRSDGGYLATTRIVVAATPAAAVAVVNSFVPVDASFPVNDPAGWSGGAMALPNGNADNAKNQSIYAVSKGTIAIIAESNQPQSIKGRQMVEQIVKNMGW